MFFKKNNLFILFCNILMILGVFLGMNSMNWLLMWMSMEITLMFFIPCLMLNKSLLESHSSLKYFIFQCLGSIFFILGSMDFFFFNTFGLFIKLGLFPNHFWMFMVSKSLKWKNLFFLLTIQKILPIIFLVFSFNYILFMFLMLILLNSFYGNMGSLNQMDLRFLMVFSSMNHMTWMILSSTSNMMYMYMYLYMYIMLSMVLYKILENLNLFYLHQIFSSMNLNLNFNLFLFSLIFFSFLGFPPFMGFFMKLISTFSLLSFLYFFLLFLLFMQNLIISYSYMRVFIYMYMYLSRSTKLSKMNMKNYIFSYFILFFFIVI